MNTGLKPVDDFLRGFSGRQKLMLAAAALAVAGVIWLFTALLARPPYAVLYKGLSPSDQQTLMQRLAAANVSFQISPDGTTLSVPASQVDRVRMQMAAQGLPRTGQMGWEIFDKPNWVGSDFDDQVNYQRALEGELERSILTLDDVAAVRVHLVLPKQSLFADEQRPAKASVVVRPRNGQMRPEEAVAIRRLVAGAVEDLKPEDVTVIDADGDVLLAPGQDSLPGAAQTLQAQLTQKLLAILTPIVGANAVHANVNIQYDPSTREISDTTYNPQGVILAATEKSSESMNGGGVSGLPGSASNVPGPQAGAPGSKNKAAAGAPTPGEIRQRESDTYAISHQETHEVDPAGRIQRITAAIVVDDILTAQTVNGKTVETRQARSPQQLQQISDLAKAAIGFDAQRGDQVVVENLPFEQPAASMPAAPGVLERVQQVGNRFSSELHYLALLVLFLLAYLLLVRPLFRMVTSAAQRAPQPALAAAAGQRPLAGESTANLPEPAPEAKRIEQIRTQIAENVRREPDNSSRLIRQWIRGGGEEPQG